MEDTVWISVRLRSKNTPAPVYLRKLITHCVSLCLTAKECGGVLTDQQRIIQSPGFPEEYQDEQICYWHIRARLGQRIRLHFLEFDVEDDSGCLADYLEVYDSYDDVSGFAGR